MRLNVYRPLSSLANAVRADSHMSPQITKGTFMFATTTTCCDHCPYVNDGKWPWSGVRKLAVSKHGWPAAR